MKSAKLSISTAITKKQTEVLVDMLAGHRLIYNGSYWLGMVTVRSSTVRSLEKNGFIEDKIRTYELTEKGMSAAGQFLMFKYRTQGELESNKHRLCYWISLNGIRSAELEFSKGKYWLPESGGVNASTVKTSFDYVPK